MLLQFLGGYVSLLDTGMLVFWSILLLFVFFSLGFLILGFANFLCLHFGD